MRGKPCESFYKFFPRQRENLIANFPKSHVTISLYNTLRILPNLLFCRKQRISLSTNFPMHVNEGKLVDKVTLCLPLNFTLVYHMHVGNLENKGKISLLHGQWGKYKVYIPSENKRIRGDHGVTLLITLKNYYGKLYYLQIFCTHSI